MSNSQIYDTTSVIKKVRKVTAIIVYFSFILLMIGMILMLVFSYYNYNAAYNIVTEVVMLPAGVCFALSLTIFYAVSLLTCAELCWQAMLKRIATKLNKTKEISNDIEMGNEETTLSLAKESDVSCQAKERVKAQIEIPLKTGC